MKRFKKHAQGILIEFLVEISLLSFLLLLPINNTFGAMVDPIPGGFDNFCEFLLYDGIDYGALTALGNRFQVKDVDLLYGYHDPLGRQISVYSGESKYLVESATGFGYASANTSEGKIKLHAKGRGFDLNWAIGGIYDNYLLGDNVNPEEVTVTVKYGGILQGLAGFGLGLIGERGFQSFGTFANERSDGEWKIPLNLIAEIDNEGSFSMGFGVFVFAFGPKSEASYSDSFQIFFSDGERLIEMPESPGGFSQIPIPPTILLLAGGVIGVLGMKRKITPEATDTFEN